MDALTYAVPTALVALILGLLFYASRRWRMPGAGPSTSPRPATTEEPPAEAEAEQPSANEGRAA